MRLARKPPQTKRPADPVAQLIHAQRTRRDWSFAKLAAAAGLQSPAYVFHIENGTKTPRPAVARRLAEALGLDAELLVAWAISRGRADLASSLQAAERVRAWLEETRALPLPAGEGERGEASSRASAAASTQPPDTGQGTAPLTSPGSITIPVLPEGADPLAADIAERAIETIHVERSMLPPLNAGARLVAFRLSAHGARRIPESLRAGDCVVVLLGDEPAGPDTPCAIRVGARVEIMRQPASAPATHLPPPRPAHDSEASATRTAAAERGRLVGRVVLAIRRWL